jgi:anti-anti-sigma factor
MYNSYSTNTNFEREIQYDIVIEKMNISRATFREAEDFRKFIEADVYSGWNKFIVNMGPCEYIDSTFIGILVNTFKLIERSGSDLKLVCDNNEVRAILEITRISEIFEIYRNTDSALKSFKTKYSESSEEIK